MIRLAVTLALGLLAAAPALAQATPVGLWRTIDDSTKQDKSLVRITESGGALVGKVERVLDATAPPDAVCIACTDERKDKPIIGMTVLKDVKPAEGGNAVWQGGEILDPNNGKTYRVRLTPIDAGKRLEVRGYIGTPLLGRTQTWVRVE